MDEKILKTAPELERLILNEIRRHAVCAGITAVTVREGGTDKESNWDVAGIYTPDDAAAAAALKQTYELLPLSQLVPDDDLVGD
jgi:hypothetical protein